ncbi:ABC transporter permease [Mycetocola reblochoni]|uniref:Oligopeptide transport system permease protein OppC (TC 3.A.1.5.1) n=2 Tax=Mycetocola reblochoni TaxID=331618 RepID=A0A1R4IWR2_9MICO|nr:ABC transporter permease [Mycetocola reblochoni]RLP70999.1 ABC transporter permease [Mycetocola reblochoni]SJN23773.1 Oligopeptide transport system permease protein OppC (TC 3.A.1.5.1) [Mycetocola reblochoni REB411]
MSEATATRRAARRAGDLAALLRSDRSLTVGLALVVGVLLMAASAPLLSAILGHGPNDQFPDETLDSAGLPVSFAPGFLLGADSSGRDVLLRTLYGSHISLAVGIPATVLSAVIGTTIGLVAGYAGGRTDAVLSELTTIALAFPFLLTALSVVTLNRGAAGTTVVDPVLVVVGIIVLFSWTSFARVVRGMVIELKGRPFVVAARGAGRGHAAVLWSEILPNLAPTVVVLAAVQLPVNIVAEATLSFLGVGTRPPTASWGNMIANAQETALYQVQPFMLLAPAAALFVTVFGFNLLATRLREHLDPRVRGGRS